MVTTAAKAQDTGWPFQQSHSRRAVSRWRRREAPAPSWEAQLRSATRCEPMQGTKSNRPLHSSEPIRHPYSRIVAGKISRVTGNEQTLARTRGGPDNGIGQTNAVLAP